LQTISLSHAQDNLEQILDRTVTDRAPTLIKRGRGEDVVLISAGIWTAMEDVLHLMTLPPNAKQRMGEQARLDAAAAGNIN
jgi:PHD/YefM family antitoxin component YafN of YafNO toxin-antitoxin module